MKLGTGQGRLGSPIELYQKLTCCRILALSNWNIHACSIRTATEHMQGVSAASSVPCSGFKETFSCYSGWSSGA